MARKQPEHQHALVLAENARVVLERRYLARDAEGNPIETPEQLLRRVADNIAQAEARYTQPDQSLRGSTSSPRTAYQSSTAEARPSPAHPEALEGAPSSDQGSGEDVSYWADRFYDLMTSLRFLPNSPTLGNAGRPLQQLSACFVLPVEDSMLSIFEAVKQTALIHQSGGGTGFAFSRLRPAGDVVQSTGGVASGPISFMRVFDAATEAIKQGGTRRGANMAILDVHHPDIEAFINLKGDMVTLTNFNISVAVDEPFLRAVEADNEYDLVNPRTGEVTGRLRARAVFDQIVANAWRNGDPGLVFLDRINADNPTPQLGPMEATNPCGEQPLLAYESCNLGSLNLARFVRPSASDLARYEVDWEALGEVIPTAVRFLDDVIDMNAYPVSEIERQTRLTRKIGLGVMGWADMLFQLDIPYDSEEALALAERLMAFIRDHADAASEALAAERGTFPAWRESIYGPEYGRAGGESGKRASGQSGSLAERASTAAPETESAPPEALRGHEPPESVRPEPVEGRDVQPGSSSGEGGRIRPVRALRNSTRTTVAPTGTLSIIADCTGGIEPAFALAFTRQHYLDPKQPGEPVRLTEVNRSFDAVARERGFYSRDLIDYLAAGGSLRGRPDVPDDIKRRFVTAHDIAPTWHVRMQAAFQRHTDNAVSKTINFPRNATIADVSEAYMLAYREGCKGITIYRDGSRTGQVLSHIADGEAYAPEPLDGAAGPDGAATFRSPSGAATTTELTLSPPDGAHRPRRRSGTGARGRRTTYQAPRPALPLSEVSTTQPCLDCGNPLIFSEGCLICRACGYTRCG